MPFLTAALRELKVASLKCFQGSEAHVVRLMHADLVPLLADLIIALGAEFRTNGIPQAVWRHLLELVLQR